MFPRSPLVVFDGVSRHQPLIAAAQWCAPVEVSPLGLQFYAAFMSIYRPTRLASRHKSVKRGD
jgi:hypothetical protein